MNSAKNISIIGAGESGTGAALLAQKLGHNVFVSDGGKIRDKYKAELNAAGISWEEGKHSTERILQADLIVKSPGIPSTAKIIREAAANGISAIGEIEFASEFTKAHITAITGSNGKTTTTLLTHHVFANAGLKVGMGGNVGKSFARLLAEENDYTHFVLEVSSFQLDDTVAFRPNIAILLNITPDHLDRYGYSFERYADSKMRIARNQLPGDAFVFWHEDAAIKAGMERNTVHSDLYAFGLEPWKESGQGAWLHNEELIIHLNNQSTTMSIHDLALQGKHNIFNSMAAGVAARILDLRKDFIRDSLSHFENIEHRLEFVAKVNGITFINDSKATNVNSTWYALESQEHPIIWIAGGVDKGNDYSELYQLAESKVKALICLGKGNEKLISAFTGRIPVITEAGSADEAVRKAYDLGSEGDVVLLSPCCASFDLFENYEDRGHQFKASVRRL